MEDLCARLPYGIICKVFNRTNGFAEEVDVIDVKVKVGILRIPISKVKPYLRPMSSMTDKEIKNLIKVKILSKYGKDYDTYEEAAEVAIKYCLENII